MIDGYGGLIVRNFQTLDAWPRILGPMLLVATRSRGSDIRARTGRITLLPCAW
jgi:hypothetical protein